MFVDPIADKFPHLSTFNYASNNPISKIDLHGLQGIDNNVLRGFINDVKDEGLGTAVSNFFNFGSLVTGTENEKVQTLSRTHKASKIPNQLKNNALDKIETTATEVIEATGASGEIVETVGDATMVTGIVVTPFAPEVGIPMVEAGNFISNTGVAMQVVSDAAQGNTEKVIKKLVVEAAPGVVTKPLNKAIKRMTKNEPMNRVILQQQTELGGLTIEQGVDQVVNGTKKEN